MYKLNYTTLLSLKMWNMTDRVGYSEHCDRRKKNRFWFVALFFSVLSSLLLFSLPFLSRCRGPNQDKPLSTNSLSVPDWPLTESSASLLPTHMRNQREKNTQENLISVYSMLDLQIIIKYNKLILWQTSTVKLCIRANFASTGFSCKIK